MDYLLSIHRTDFADELGANPYPADSYGVIRDSSSPITCIDLGGNMGVHCVNSTGCRYYESRSSLTCIYPFVSRVELSPALYGLDNSDGNKTAGK